MDIELPYNFNLRPYQKPLWDSIKHKYKKVIGIWHRRSGKDILAINIIAKEMFKRKGAYYHFFPTYTQGKKVIWNGITRDGIKMLDYIPQQLRKRTNDSEMLIETINGSIYQVIGSDDFDRIVGTNPIGCVFSEYALQDPKAYDYIRPILAENDGWAMFLSTPRGRNHLYDLYNMAKANPKDWFASRLTVEDTNAISRNVLEQERAEIMKQHGDDALYRQEYMVSFEAPIAGAYYANLMIDVEDAGRIGTVPYDPIVPVNTAWDLGVGDTTAIWFYQLIGKEIRLIDCYETSGEGLQHFAKVLQDKKYVYGEHVAPFDIEVRELGSNAKTRLEIAKGLGIKFKIAPKMSIEDGIEAVRNILPFCWFDSKNCERGINALRSYQKVYDEKNKSFHQRPLHDWSSNFSDSLRYLAVTYRREYKEKKERSHSEYNPINPLTGY